MKGSGVRPSQLLSAEALQRPVESAQYGSLGSGQQARDAGIAVSMGSKGNVYDKAVAESFFATIKKELVHRQSWPSRRHLSSADFEYIEAFYNQQSPLASASSGTAWTSSRSRRARSSARTFTRTRFRSSVRLGCCSPPGGICAFAAGTSMRPAISRVRSWYPH